MKLFGTDGIRGEAGSFPLDERTIRLVGESMAQRLAESLGRSPKVIVGYDTRESSPWIERALIPGLAAGGCEYLSAGVITTPGVAFLARRFAADAGIVISASHNPYQDNGIKVFSSNGRKIDDAMERAIEADIEGSQTHENVEMTFNDLEGRVDPSLREEYLAFLVEEIGQAISLSNIKMVVDCANGSASEIAPKVFRSLGAQVVAINDAPNGRNINQNCGSLHLNGLQKVVLAERAGIGVAFDGDADRALFVDKEGEIVDGDATLFVLANHLDERGHLDPKTVVATVMSNLGLEIALKQRGVELRRTDVGDKYVLEELLRTGAILGGEQSGHIIFPNLSLAGDGIITALKLLDVLQQSQQNLSALLEGFRRYPQILTNVRVQTKVPFESLPRVSRAKSDVERLLGDRGRLLLRYSGTELLARIMIEGESKSEIELLANRIATAIEEEVG